MIMIAEKCQHPEESGEAAHQRFLARAARPVSEHPDGDTIRWLTGGGSNFREAVLRRALARSSGANT